MSLRATSLRPMNTSSNQAVRVAVFCLAVSCPLPTVFSQTPSSASPPAEAVVAKPAVKENARKQTVGKPAYQEAVRPIYRAKQPAKQVAVDWTALPSTFTHDANKQRVDQFALPVEAPSSERADFVRSGFRHTRSSLQGGFGADHYHVTEQWGGPVQPYGEWRYPNRPFSVPYGQWGPQLPQVVAGGSLWGLGGPNGFGPGPRPGAWQGNGPMSGQGNGHMNGQGNGPGQNVPNGMQPGPGLGPGNGNGNGNGQPWGTMPGHGQWPGANQGWNVGEFGVGPGNALQANQDEYYQQAPTLQTPEYHPLQNGNLQMPIR